MGTTSYGLCQGRDGNAGVQMGNEWVQAEKRSQETQGLQTGQEREIFRFIRSKRNWPNVVISN